MLEILKALQKEYGDISIGELIKKLEPKKEPTVEYRLYQSLIGNIYIASNKQGWSMQSCKDKSDAEKKIMKLVKEDEMNGLKSVYKRKVICKTAKSKQQIRRTRCVEV